MLIRTTAQISFDVVTALPRPVCALLETARLSLRVNYSTFAGLEIFAAFATFAA